MYGQRISLGAAGAAKVKDRGTFSCVRCRHWQRAEVTGVGIGVSSHLGAEDSARDRGRASAARDVRRTLRFATCPRCKQRSGHSAFVAPYVLASFAAIAAAILFACVIAHVKQGAGGAAGFQLYFPLLVAALAALVTPYALVNRWKHNDQRIQWLDF